jgi:hypothetical protein
MLAIGLLVVGAGASHPAVADTTDHGVATPDSTSPVSMHVEFGASGLSSLKAGDSELLTDGSFKLNDLQIAGSGVTADDFDPIKQAFDPGSTTLE